MESSFSKTGFPTVELTLNFIDIHVFYRLPWEPQLFLHAGHQVFIRALPAGLALMKWYKFFLTHGN